MKNIAFIIGDTLPPESLYKFGCFDSERHFVDLIKNNDIYLSCPEDFNDPFDCAIIPDFSQLNDEQFTRMIRNVWEIEPSIRNSYPEFDNELVSIFRENQSELAEIYRTYYKKTLGICCFTEEKDNELMWSHYSRGHRGFCLKFATFEKENWLKNGIILRPVIYSLEYPTFCLSTNSSEWTHQWPMIIAKTKSRIWEYEKEWRLMRLNGARERLQYDDVDLKSIYIGVGCKEEDVEMIKCLIRDKNPRPKLYKGKMADYKYKIEFEEIPNE